jgi:hypothetical protein
MTGTARVCAGDVVVPIGADVGLRGISITKTLTTLLPTSPTCQIGRSDLTEGRRGLCQTAARESAPRALVERSGNNHRKKLRRFGVGL